MLRKSLLAIASVLVFNCAYADLSRGGFYAGVGGGYGSSGVTGSIFGGYMFGKYLGLEASYNVWAGSSSSVSISNQSYGYSQTPQAINGLLLLNLPLGVSPVSIHAKLGVAYVNINGSTVYSGGYSVTPNGSGLTSTAGLGVGMNVGNNILLSLDWLNYGFVQPVAIANSQNQSWTSNNFLLNLGYHF